MAARETVTVIRKPPRDNFGNRQGGLTDQWTIPGWRFAPGPSQEMTAVGAQVESDATVYGPPVTQINEIVQGGIRPTDIINVRDDDYAIVGRVQDWGRAGCVIVLKLVTG